MPAVRPSAYLDRVYRFGDFEYFVRSGELFQNRKVVRLQYQPLRVLLVLLENSGEVVTHDEIRDRVWRDASIQAFDNSLRVAINKLRQALRDDPTIPSTSRHYRAADIVGCIPCRSMTQSETPAKGRTNQKQA